MFLHVRTWCIAMKRCVFSHDVWTSFQIQFRNRFTSDIFVSHVHPENRRKPTLSFYVCEKSGQTKRRARQNFWSERHKLSSPFCAFILHANPPKCAGIECTCCNHCVRKIHSTNKIFPNSPSTVALPKLPVLLRGCLGATEQQIFPESEHHGKTLRAVFCFEGEME